MLTQTTATTTATEQLGRQRRHQSHQKQ